MNNAKKQNNQGQNKHAQKHAHTKTKTKAHQKRSPGQSKLALGTILEPFSDFSSGTDIDFAGENCYRTKWEDSALLPETNFEDVNRSSQTKSLPLNRKTDGVVFWVTE